VEARTKRRGAPLRRRPAPAPIPSFFECGYHIAVQVCRALLPEPCAVECGNTAAKIRAAVWGDPRPAGLGRLGEVYRARDERPERDGALRLFPP